MAQLAAVRQTEVLLDTPHEQPVDGTVRQRPGKKRLRRAALAAKVHRVCHQHVIAWRRDERPRSLLVQRDDQDAARVKVGRRRAVRHLRDAVDDGCSCRAAERRRIELERPSGALRCDLDVAVEGCDARLALAQDDAQHVGAADIAELFAAAGEDVREDLPIANGREKPLARKRGQDARGARAF